MTKRSRPKIMDFGEYIPGARKDLATHGLRTGMAEDPGFKSTLSKTWPKPPWEEIERQHVLENRNTADLALARAVRDFLKTADGRRIEQGLGNRLVNPDEGPKTMRTIALAVLQGDLSHHDALEQISAQRVWATTQCKHKMTLYQATGHRYDLSKYRCAEAKHRSGPLASQTYWEIWYRYKDVAKGETFAEAANALRAYVAKEGSLDTPAPKTRSAEDPFVTGFDRRSGVRVHGVLRKAGGRWRMLQEYESREASMDALTNERERKKLEAKWAAWLTIPPERRVANERRTPGAVEGTANPNEFIRRFGFRGVQFGNWVEKTRRSTDLHEASQGLADLARALHWPQGLLALNGRLALAFGARGKGGRNPAKAHYESVQRVIAISKPTGPGSLAHEWFHALDNTCFDITDTRYSGFGTESSIAGWWVHTREQMDPFVQALSELGSLLRVLPMRDRSAKLDMRRPKSKAYWATIRELGARAFEAWVIEQLRKIGIRNDYLANIRMPDEWEGKNELDQGYPYPYEDELMALAPHMKKIAELGLKRLANGAVSTGLEAPLSSQAAQRAY